MPKGQRQTERAQARIGEQYGLLTITEWVGSNKYRLALYKFSCACGNECMRTLVSVKNGGDYTSCGCSAYATASMMRLKHGHSMRGATSPEYVVWQRMIQRCTPGQTHRDAKWYSDKGVRVCERWADFKNFIADMGPRPSDDHEIDRIDPDGDYSPSNCRWLPMIENRRRAMAVRWEKDKQN